MSTHVPPIWFRTQRVLRTIVQALIILVPLANGAAVAVAAYLQEQTHLVIPPWAFLVLNAVVAVTAVVMGLLARLMAVPGVNDWLTRIGLGSVPRNVVVHESPETKPAAGLAVDVEQVTGLSADQRFRHNL